MKISKLLKTTVIAAAAILATSFATINVSEAAEDEAVAAETQVQQPTYYRYTSKKYGYSMQLPMKPLGVIPAGAMFEGEDGEVLVFDNEEYDIKKAWVVIVNSFKDGDIPHGLLNATDQEKQDAIKAFSQKGLFDLVRVADMDNGKAGMFCISAKEIEVDTDQDGVADEIMTADNQMMMTYFWGDYGGKFMVGLLQNPTMTQESQMEYQHGLITFQQWPTAMGDM